MNEYSSHTSSDPYDHSLALSFLQARILHKKPLRITFFDIDGTLVMEDTVHVSAEDVRKAYKEKGFLISTITSRPEDMLLSHKTQELSRNSIASLHAPHLLFVNGKYCYIDPKSLASFIGVVDFPIAIAETGSRILLQQGDMSFKNDEAYEATTNSPHTTWRNETIEALTFLIEKGVLPNIFEKNFPAMDFDGNFESGTEPVKPVTYQFHVDFADSSKTPEENKHAFESFINLFEKIRREAVLPYHIRTAINHIRLVNDSNPSENRYSLYITPLTGSKAKAIDHVLTTLCEKLSIDRSKFEIIIAGDSYTDLDAIIYAGIGAKTTGVVVGGARITEELLSYQATGIVKNMGSSQDKVLLNHDESGFYTISEFGRRRIVIGDVDFPGTKGPESLITVLHELYH